MAHVICEAKQTWRIAHVNVLHYVQARHKIASAKANNTGTRMSPSGLSCAALSRLAARSLYSLAPPVDRKIEATLAMFGSVNCELPSLVQGWSLKQPGPANAGWASACCEESSS